MKKSTPFDERGGQDQRRFLFCINSGRSGSEYLARLLGTARNVYAFHEAEPCMIGPYLRMVQERGLESTFIERSIKAQAIQHYLGMLPQGSIYAETSHMFVKTFHDIIMKVFSAHDIDVIILRRYLPGVLMSFITMGYFSNRNSVWPDWMPVPGTGDCVFQPPPFESTPDQYDLAIGYLLDIEARARLFALQHPQSRVHEVRLEQIQTPDEVTALFDILRLETTEKTLELPGRRVNERTHRKAHFGIETSIEYCEQRIAQYLDRCMECNVAVPEIPQMSI